MAFVCKQNCDDQLFVLFNFIHSNLHFILQLKGCENFAFIYVFKVVLK